MPGCTEEDSYGNNAFSLHDLHVYGHTPAQEPLSWERDEIHNFCTPFFGHNN